MRFILQLLIVCLAPFSLFSQNQVTGLVTDEKDGSSLPGVSVRLQGTDKGTVTDPDGKFALEVPNGLFTLEFTYVGYQKFTVPVAVGESKSKFLKVVMTEESKDLDIVVVTGSKYEKKLGEETVSMEVLRQGAITQTNYRVEESMNRIPGLNMVGKNASIRGGSGFSDGAGSRVLCLLDDMPMMSPENGEIQWSTIPVEAIEQIEVIKGASSALYGSSALNGIINIRTMNPKPEMYNKIILNYGFYFQPKNKDFSWFWRTTDTTKRVYDNNGNLTSVKTKERVSNRPMFGSGQFLHMKKYGDFDVVLGANYSQDQSYMQFNSHKKVRISGKFRWIPKKIKGLTVGLNTNVYYYTGEEFFIMAGYSGPGRKDSVYDFSTFQWTLVDRDSLTYIPEEPNRNRERIFNIDPYVTYHDKHNNKHSLRFRVYNTMLQTGNYYPSTSPIASPGDSSNSFQFMVDYSFVTRIEKCKLNIATGIMATYGDIEGKTFSGGKKRAGNIAAYVQLDRKFWDMLTLSAGMRLEYFKVDTFQIKNDLELINSINRKLGKKDNVSIPVQPVFRLGANLQAAEATYIRASFGQGYRFPSVAELFVRTRRSGIPVIPNSSLRPEEGWSAEMGIKQGVKVSKWLAFFDLAGYITQYKDMIEFSPVKGGPFTFQAQNVDRARIWGIEASGMGQGKIYGVDFNFLVGYTYMNPRKLNYNPNDPSDSPYLRYRVEHAAKADIQTSWKGFMLGSTFVYTSFMRFVDPNIISAYDYIDQFRQDHNRGDFVWDLRAGYTYKEKIGMNVICKNVMNREYTLRPGFLEAPTNLTFQVSYQF